jgi:deoxyribose-phosphate aldolase
VSNDATRLKILSLIDLTSLNDSDDRATIEQLCKKAIVQQGHVAAVCVSPRFVKQVAEYFLNSPVKIATVVNFPHGMDALDSVTSSIQQVIHQGAQEVDVVFPYRQYLSGAKDAAYEFIQACKMMCGKDVLLKVILETGELKHIAIITEISHGVLIDG